jgi:outer membrane protein assembly factor BamB
MVPQFESRWEPTAETKAADYWKTLDQSAPSVDTEQHLNSPTPPEAKLAVSPLDWPQFEGPKRDGVARGVHVRSDWRENPPRRMWDHPVGAGWSSFAVVGKYALTQEQRDDDEAVVCYDADTGRQLWAHLDRGARHSTVLGGLGPRATPTVSGSRVYTFGATGILNCLDPESGGLIWSTNAVKEAGVPPVQFGMSGSPLVYDNVVVVNPGGIRTSMADRRESGRAVIAYDRLTGQRIWATGDYQAGYASPILATIGGVRQVIIYDAVGAGGYDAATGNELWRSPEWMNSTYNNIAQPIILPDRSIFLSSGYGTGSILFDAHKSGDLWTVKERWRAPNKFKLKFNTGVYRDGFVYGLDEGILACLDLSNGKLRWKKGRYSYGEVLLLKDLLLVLSEEGDAVLVEISPSGSREVSRFHAISGKTWNHPAISRERLYVRNGEEAACFDLSSQQTAAR